MFGTSDGILGERLVLKLLKMDTFIHRQFYVAGSAELRHLTRCRSPVPLGRAVPPPPVRVSPDLPIYYTARARVRVENRPDSLCRVLETTADVQAAAPRTKGGATASTSLCQQDDVVGPRGPFRPTGHRTGQRLPLTGPQENVARTARRNPPGRLPQPTVGADVRELERSKALGGHQGVERRGREVRQVARHVEA